MSDSAKANVNPTEIYNEGWMTRLLVYYSVKEEIEFKGINFKNMHWTSEALISSPFVGGEVKEREGYTHADIMLGNFKVDYKTRGEITVDDNAKNFGIIEAKMGSPLSKRTTNAPNYNQASRNVTCIADNTKDTCNTFFFVLAPEVKIKPLKKHVTKGNIKTQIKERFIRHNKENPKIKDEDAIKKRAGNCDIGVITYEEWIEKFRGKDYHKFLDKFYFDCKTYNKIK